jgi:hypothetical protein
VILTYMGPRATFPSLNRNLQAGDTVDVPDVLAEALLARLDFCLPAEVLPHRRSKSEAKSEAKSDAKQDVKQETLLSSSESDNPSDSPSSKQSTGDL